MNRKLKIFKTYEIPDEYWQGITSGFNRVFNQNKEPGYFQKYYSNSVLGFSYHAIVFDNENNIIASNSLIPSVYEDATNGELIFGLSCGTFVLEDFRDDIYILKDMLNALWSCSADEGVVASLGVPNKNSFRYSMTFLDSALIGYLPYYILPVRLFNVVAPGMAFLNVFSILGSYVLVGLNHLLSLILNNYERISRFQLKITNEFYTNRFGSDNYCEAEVKNIKFWYRAVSEKNVNTLYLFDFRENGKRTFRALVICISGILKREKPDIILFIGHLKLNQTILLRLPRRLEPQRLPLTFNITDPRFCHYMEPMSEENNWNFGLMNFDVR